MRIKLHPVRNTLFPAKLEFVKLIKFCSGLGLAESKALMDRALGDESVELEILPDTSWDEFKHFMEQYGIGWTWTSGEQPTPTPAKLLKMQLLRQANGSLYSIERLIEAVKLLRDGTEPKIGLKEAKDLLDALREGKTIEYSLGKRLLWDEFRDFFKKEHVEIQEVGSSSTETITFVIMAFNGSFSTELDLRNYLADLLDLTIYEVMTKLDGLRFGKTFLLKISAAEAANLRQQLNRFEVHYREERPQSAPQAVSDPMPQRDEIPTEYSTVRCRLMASGHVSNKLMAIRILKTQSHWGLKECKDLIDAVSEDMPQEVTVSTDNFALFKQDLATENIQVVVLEWIR